MTLEAWLVCGLAVAFNLFMCFRYMWKSQQVTKFYRQLRRKNATELDLELATTDQLINALVNRPGYPLVLITPKNEEQLEVHVRNVTPLGVCSLLATAQLVVLNQEPMKESDREEKDD